VPAQPLQPELLVPQLTLVVELAPKRALLGPELERALEVALGLEVVPEQQQKSLRRE